MPAFNPTLLPPVGGKGVLLHKGQRTSVTADQLRARTWLSVARAPTEPRPHALGSSLPLGRSLPLGGSLPLSGKPLLQLGLAAPIASLARSARDLLLAPPPDEAQREALSSRDDLISPSSSARSNASTQLWRGKLGGQSGGKGGTRGGAAQPQPPQPLDAGSRARQAAPPQQQLRGVAPPQQQLEVTVTADPKARPPPEARLEIESEIEHAEAGPGGKGGVPGPVPIVHVVPPPTACKPTTADKGERVAKGTTATSTSTSTSSSAAAAAAAAAAAGGCTSSSWYTGGADGVSGTLWLGEGDAHPVSFRFGGGGARPPLASLKGAVAELAKASVSGRDGVRRGKVVVVLAADLAAEVSVAGRHPNAKLLVSYRKPSETEVEKQSATYALLEAEGKTNYTTLLAQMKRGHHRGVEAVLLERAAAKLKTLKPKVPALEELRKKLFKGKRTAAPSKGPEEDLGGACGMEGCRVEETRSGEVLRLDHNGAEAAFETLRPKLPEKERGQPADEWLFNVFATAAVRAAADGGVWKAYGKFNLSAPSRNQSPQALRNYLVRIEQTACASALDCLVAYIEKEFKKKVAAVQINVHMDSTSSHVNHRDVYGGAQKERVGANCTCSFTTAAATACFSLGSSRRGSFRTETDKHSNRRKCCDACGGNWRKPWLHSGTLCYFNSLWNDNHTHGIPLHDVEADGECGPRISVALLCAESTESVADMAEEVCQMLPRKPKLEVK